MISYFLPKSSKNLSVFYLDLKTIFKKTVLIPPLHWIHFFLFRQKLQKFGETTMKQDNREVERNQLPLSAKTPRNAYK